MEKLVLSFPLPPTINQTYHAYPVGKTCRIVIDQRARDYKEFVREYTTYIWQAEKPFEITQDTRFVLRLWMFLNKNSRDVDANIKLVMDGIMLGIKDATGLEGMSDVRVFSAELKKVLTREANMKLCPCLVVELSEWHEYGEVPVFMSSTDLDND
jgi:hypothetical protein